MSAAMFLKRANLNILLIERADKINEINDRILEVISNPFLWSDFFFILNALLFLGFQKFVNQVMGLK